MFLLNKATFCEKIHSAISYTHDRLPNLTDTNNELTDCFSIALTVLTSNFFHCCNALNSTSRNLLKLAHPRQVFSSRFLQKTCPFHLALAITENFLVFYFMGSKQVASRVTMEFRHIKVPV